MHTVKGVGRVRFQLEFGELLEVSRVRFVLEMKENKLSVPTLENDGYAVVFKKKLIFIYALGVDPVQPVLIGD